MDKDNMNSEFDFDSPEFSANFYKNIEKAIGDIDSPAEPSAGVSQKTSDEETELSVQAPAKAEDTVESSLPAEDIRKADKAWDNDKDAGVSTAVEAIGAETVDTSESISDSTGSSSGLSDENVEDELIGISSALAQQICLEMDHIGAEAKAERKKFLFRIQSGIALTILCLIGFGFFLGFTKPGNNLLMGMGINLGGTIWAGLTGNFKDNTDVAEDIDYVDQEDVEAKGEEIDPGTIVWPNHTGMGRQEEGVYNILLLGEEAIGSGDARGRTDVIVIATLNTNTKKVMLTSLMRDTFVQIPGFKDNKLNVAYEEGGIDLLYETIALNFDLHIDGCVMVNFENFEKIIDKLGGINIPLTSGEARYLNSTNYISDPANRNVVEGTQLMNGNQVLGYARIRKRANINGTNNDYGRTERHRIILNAIFEKYKTTSKTELLSMIFEFLPMITTDIDSKNFEALLNAYVDMGTSKIDQLRIPADGAFQDNVKVRGMSVLIPNLEENIQILHSFIFGDDTAQNTDGTATDSTGTATDAGVSDTGTTDTSGDSGN